MKHIIKVTLAEDGDALRRSLADSLREQPDISVLGEAAEGGELVALCRETPPDVAVVDIRMPGMDGLELVERAMALLALGIRAYNAKFSGRNCRKSGC